MATKISATVPVLKNGVHFMTSDFGPRTYTYNGKKVSDNHKGVDLIGKGYATDYIIAAAAGKVVIAQFSSSAGYYVRIDHGNGVYTRYMHMKAGSLQVKVGQTVAKGQVLGYMGSTGQSTGAHLHFDVCVNGTYIDPKPYLSGEKSLVSGAATAKPSTTTGTAAKTFKVGDIVEFTGTKHYTNANAASGKACKPGKAKVTAVYNGKHPYHLVRESGGGSTVYGWVDAADIVGASTSTPTATTKPTPSAPKVIKIGDVVNFTGSKHYTNANAAVGFKCRGGKAKVTAIATGKKHPYHLVRVSGGGSTVYGWVDASDIS